jgi:hypothetical protein
MSWRPYEVFQRGVLRNVGLYQCAEAFKSSNHYYFIVQHENLCEEKPSSSVSYERQVAFIT